jgi:hypothetical protein
MGGPFVVDAHSVFEGRAIQPLVQTVFDSPIVPIMVEKLFGRQLTGRTAGDQVFHLRLGFLAILAVQTANLRRPGQA